MYRFLGNPSNKQIVFYKYIFEKNNPSYIESIILEFWTVYIIWVA